MKHVGIDLGATKTALCILSTDGLIERERTIRTDELSEWFEEQSPALMIMESCAESRVVASLAQRAGHQARVVPSVIVRALGVGARRIKTDRKDALALANASFRLGEQLPAIHLRSDASAATTTTIRGRWGLVQLRTRCVNFVRAQLRKDLIGRPRASSATFTAAVRTKLKARGEVPSPIVESYLKTIDASNEQISAIDEQLERLAQTELHRRLRVVPGVGPVIAVAMVAMIDDPKRFASASHLASYLGLSPGENTTGGGKPYRTGIIAAGQPLLRSLLVQGAWSLMQARRRNDPLALWARELAAKKSKRIAVVALARRLAIVLWAMMRDGTSYNPALTAPRPPPQPQPVPSSPAAEVTVTR